MRSRLVAPGSQRHDVVVIEPPIAVPGFDVAMFWHPRRERDPAVRWLRERLRSAAAMLL